MKFIYLYYLILLLIFGYLDISFYLITQKMKLYLSQIIGILEKIVYYISENVWLFFFFFNLQEHLSFP